MRFTRSGFIIALMLGTFALQAQNKIGGLALYTVRDQMGENPKETLAQVAEIGYRNIEAAGYQDGKFYGMTPADFEAYLKEVGLHPVSTHQSTVTLENADKMIADVKAAGFTYFVVPIPPMGMFAYNAEEQKMYMKGTAKELADILAELGEKCNEAGLTLLYHNHDFEFAKDAEGNVILDYLLENLDPDLVNFQLDLYWATRAGVDPVAYFEKYPGRFKSWHVKDMDAEGRFAPVGTGSIDFERIFDKKKLAGMKYYFVEQDRTFDGQQPLEAIRISHDALEEIKGTR
ncbi:MAG: sugar phosphate isomerase/epimerase [Cyclobacteriaceae bacterium]